MHKRILICSNIYPPNFIGGAELVAHAQAKALARLGNVLTVFAGERTPGRQRYSLWREEYEGLEVFRVQLAPDDFNLSRNSCHNPQVERAFREVLDCTKPDVVHAHNLAGLSAGLLREARQSGAITVITVHDHWGFCQRNTLLRENRSPCLNQYACYECFPDCPDVMGRTVPIQLRNDFVWLQFDYVDAVVSPSRYLARMYERMGLARGKYHVVHNGVDFDRFALRQPPRALGDPVRFVYIGYIGEHKGVDLLLEAFTKIAFKTRTALTFVGDGHLLNELKARVRQCGMHESVNFKGKVEPAEIPRILECSDCLVLPSVWPENQPICIVEAMAAGIPVIAPRIGGIPELIEDGVNGHLFNPGDVDDLASKMRSLAERPDQVQEMGRKGRECLGGASIENQARCLLDIYDRIERSRSVPASRVRLDWGRWDDSDVVLVGCLGNRFDWISRDVIRRMSDSGSPRQYRFVHWDWLQEERRHVRVAWVADRSLPLSVVEAPLKLSIPLLVPETHVSLREVCSRWACGLYYATPWDAEACLRLLAGESEVRAQLSANAHICSQAYKPA